MCGQSLNSVVATLSIRYVVCRSSCIIIICIVNVNQEYLLSSETVKAVISVYDYLSQHLC